MGDKAAYRKWTRDSLVNRIEFLEEHLRRNALDVPTSHAEEGSNAQRRMQIKDSRPGLANSSFSDEPQRQKEKRTIDPCKHNTRFVALKLAYLGRNYSGFEYAASGGATLPSVEEELWRALAKGCLIFPEDPRRLDWTQCEYSKSGRTDRGVSAFGQVVGLRMRSSRPLHGRAAAEDELGGGENGRKKKNEEWDSVADELPYARLLNRLLPPDIRILAWCPDPPEGFSARFSCKERQYRYYFTQPAFAPWPRPSSSSCSTETREGWLDLNAMRQAAKLYEGLQDFRNFCKIDPAKQTTNFVRRVFEADIVEAEYASSTLGFLNRPEFRPGSGTVAGGEQPTVYYLHVRGSAFLWHQIRHMVSVLFAVGQGLEKPSVVADLLDITKTPRRPNYVLADEAPLVLWDCVFPASSSPQDGAEKSETPYYPPDQANMRDALAWLWLGEDRPENIFGRSGLVDQLWQNWRRSKMDEILAGRLLDNTAARLAMRNKPPFVRRVYEGADSARQSGTWVSMKQKPTLLSPEEANDKWARTKGFKDAAQMTRDRNWRAKLKHTTEGPRATVVGEGTSTVSVRTNGVE